ncbi:MAG: hypothetical protein ACOY94_03740 [Bacillota bacterium]
MQRTIVGFDRRLDLEWLDAAAALMAEGNTEAEVRGRMRQILAVSQGPKALTNTLTVLGRLWWRAPEKLAPMQARALALLPHVEPSERIAVHWSLCLAVYPFFLDTARFAGRLLSLQGEVKMQQLEMRVAELWGARATIPRAVQRITRSMVQWGLLRDSGQVGVFTPAPQIHIKGDLGALLVEGLLRGQPTGGLTREQLYGHPAFFPFEMDVRPYDLRQRAEFQVLRQGVDVEMVTLRQV